MNLHELIVATPTDGDPKTAVVSCRYHEAMLQVVARGGRALPGKICFSDDLARARSRCVSVALQQPGWKWLLFWDDDVAPADTDIIHRMEAVAKENGYDVIGAPYPRKRINVAFPYKPMTSALKEGRLKIWTCRKCAGCNTPGSWCEKACVEVEYLAIGFMMISRHCLEQMVKFYADEWFTDPINEDPTKSREVVALFKPVTTPEKTILDFNKKPMRYRELLSEDYSFCYRWRGMGGKVHMYLGDGSPLPHIGPHAFTGTMANIGSV